MLMRTDTDLGIPGQLADILASRELRILAHTFSLICLQDTLLASADKEKKTRGARSKNQFLF